MQALVAVVYEQLLQGIQLEGLQSGFATRVANHLGFKLSVFSTPQVSVKAPEASPKDAGVDEKVP